MKKAGLKKICIDMLLYSILLLPLHAATAAAVDGILKRFALFMLQKGVSYSIYAPIGFIFAVILLFASTLGLTLGLLFLRFPRQYEPSPDRRLRLKKALLGILPGGIRPLFALSMALVVFRTLCADFLLSAYIGVSAACRTRYRRAWAGDPCTD